MSVRSCALLLTSLLLAGCARGVASSPAAAVRPADAVAPPSGARAPASVAFDPLPRVAVMSALESEWALLRAAMTVTGTRVVNGRTHYVGRLAGQEVVLLLSGVSMVNAAMTTQALLDRYAVRAIVFTGIAGGVNPSLRVGDVTVPAAWANYQEHAFARETPAGWVPGRFAGALGNFGMMFPRPSMVADGVHADSTVLRTWFDADSGLVATARRVAATVTLARCVAGAGGACLSHTPQVVVGGRGVSGPTFVDNAAYREWTWRQFAADALDMETAAVAHVAWHTGTPFIAFRSLSDLAGGGAEANELRTFGRLAADNSAALVLAFLRALPPS
jgi:adenosylhomocysteine nucleosidase